MHVLIMYCSLFRQQIHLIAMKTEIATDVQLILMLNIAKIWDSREVWFISMNDHVFQPYFFIFHSFSPVFWGMFLQNLGVGCNDELGMHLFKQVSIQHYTV